MQERSAWGLVVVVAIALAFTLAFLKGAWAQKIHHHEGMSKEVDKFYSTWYMPDNPSKSCCDKQDCYPAQARFDGKQWYVMRREDRKILPVPWSKVEMNRDNPDGRNHVCAPPPGTGHGDTVFCFSIGGGI